MVGTTSKEKPGVDVEYSDLNIFRNASPQDGSLNIDLELRAAITEAIRVSGKERSQIREELYKFTQTDLSIHTLNTWTAESKSKSSKNEDQNNNKRWGIPAEMLVAICYVTDDNRPLELMVEKIGLKLMTPKQQAALRLSEMKEQKKKLAREIKAQEKLWGRIKA